MSTQNKFLDFKGLLHFYDSVIKNHNALSYTYYKTHPGEIVNLPKEIIYKYFPEVLMIVEPLSSDIFVVKEGASTNPILHVDDGVITVDKVKEIYKSNNWVFDPASTQIILDPYSCSAIKYYNISNCEITPKEIVKLPKEIIYEYFPDILMIIEPLNGSVIIPGKKSSDPYYTLETTNGIIDINSVRKAYDGLGNEYPAGLKKYFINVYNCSAIKYCNLEKVDLCPGTVSWGSSTKPENQLKLIEGLVGWKNLDPIQFDWWTEPTYSDTKRQIWWDEGKITINGDWYLCDENIMTGYSTEYPVNYLKMTNFCRLENYEQKSVAREIEFNGTMYIGNLYYDGLGWAFTNLRCYQFPTFDFTRYKFTYLDRAPYYYPGQRLSYFIYNRNFNWTPERPQRCLVKGIGYGMGAGTPPYQNAGFDFGGIIDWDYDDMIASLITYANNSNTNPGGSQHSRFYVSQKSYDKLTEDDIAAIVAMGNAIAVDG